MKIALCTELRNAEWFESRLRSLFAGTDSLSSTSYGMRSSYLRHSGEADIMRASFPEKNKKESCSQDSPPAAGRFCDILPNRRSAILAERFM